VAAGVRRVEAVTGIGAVDHHVARARTLDAVLATLGTPAEQAVASIEKLQGEVKRLTRELREARIRAATAPLPGRQPEEPATAGGGEARGGATDVEGVQEVAGVRLLTRRIGDLDKEAVRELADRYRDQIKSGVVVLASEHEGKVGLVVAVTRDLTPRVHAGRVVKAIAPLVGGGGGGRPDFAEAGGRDAARIEAALVESRAVVERMLAGN